MKRKNKAQALAEFVILIPILLVFFIGIWQFAEIFITKIKIAILEREIMMYITSDIDEEENVNEFVENYSKILGLKYENLDIKYKSFLGDNLKGNFLINVFNKFISIRVIISYKEKLLPLFSLITGKKQIKLTTDLHTAHGGSFNLTLDNMITKLVQIFDVRKDDEKNN